MAAGGAVNARLQAQGWGSGGPGGGAGGAGAGGWRCAAPPVVAMMPVSWARVLGGGVAPPFLSAFGAHEPVAAAARSAAAAPAAAVSLETVMALAARTAGGAVDADAPLMEAGLDSLGAVELRNQLQQARPCTHPHPNPSPDPNPYPYPNPCPKPSLQRQPEPGARRGRAGSAEHTGLRPPDSAADSQRSARRKSPRRS